MRLASRSAQGASLPYELISGNTDPFTGTLRNPLPLPRGNPLVASYASIVADALSGAANAPVTSSLFQPETPVDGAATFVRMALGQYYDEGAVITPGTVADTATTLGVVPLVYKAAVVEKTVAVSATGLPAPSTLDRADLVVSDVGGIVYTEDVRSRISAGGALTVNVNLPDGLVSNGYATGVYSFAVRTRALGSTTPAGTTWYRSTSQLNLRPAGASTTIAIP